MTKDSIHGNSPPSIPVATGIEGGELPCTHERIVHV